VFDGEIVEGDIVELPTPDHYEVSWRIPEDNGVPIDYYLLTYYPVRKESTGESTIWRQIGDIKKVEIPHKGNVRWSMQLDYQDTFYKVELMAHNQLGFSAESILIIKSGRGPIDAVTKKPGPWKTNIDSVPLGPLIGGVVAVLLLVLLLVDISCYKLNQ
jgi:neurocan core protein